MEESVALTSELKGSMRLAKVYSPSLEQALASTSALLCYLIITIPFQC